MVPFQGKDDVQRADKVVAEKLKEMFQPHLPKMEDFDEQMDGQNGVAHSASDEDGFGHNDDKDDSFFTKQPVKEEPENKRVAMSDDGEAAQGLDDQEQSDGDDIF